MRYGWKMYWLERRGFGDNKIGLKDIMFRKY